MDNLTPVSTVELDDGPVTDMRFITLGGSQYLALLISARCAILVLDVTHR